MPLVVSEVSSMEEFRPIVEVEWEAYDTPNNPFWNILKGSSIEECTVRQWAWHSAVPGSRWIKVLDSENGRIVGAAEWIIHEQNPFQTAHPPLEVSWWPDNGTFALLV